MKQRIEYHPDVVRSLKLGPVIGAAGELTIEVDEDAARVFMSVTMTGKGFGGTEVVWGMSREQVKEFIEILQDSAIRMLGSEIRAGADPKS